MIMSMNEVNLFEARIGKVLGTKEGSQKLRVEELEHICASSDLWEESLDKARILTAELANGRKQLERWQSWRRLLADAEAATRAVSEEADEEARVYYQEEAKHALTELERDLEAFELEQTMDGPYDKLDCRLEIQAGAGGVDAQDWCAMLLRMYLRCLESRFDEVRLVESVDGEAPNVLKSAALEVKGAYAFGFLRGEKGAHRLVRQSPFNANAKRHTSFVSVEPIPILDDEDDDDQQDIPESDLSISTMRSGGSGGQNVNKVETAVRITHNPTGLTVRCEKERSQSANKKIALSLLKAKLLIILQEQKAVRIADIRGEKVQADFGSSLRNYVLHPYKLVKDSFSGFETSNALDVLDGPGLDQFLDATLRHRASLSSSSNNKVVDHHQEK
eukprot:CAMPEP_0197309328 /NCGR_PEP_ID=MMETSP0891-20130614/7895_1 /TAXON_ID=44058 ORGANISM="Aureoumbra lagunensis, Strain CCMP1510" /NCGR_SAMPLE_ID=MMETSP0891 /ASSEMBLY_ACC=CAM_ASM_000534 /LENGTH=389 /DNA_ID=CAMNT_0042794319 /DNA_START=15 /DNA_END=1185 /DNA_ORIENTATION=+